MQWRHHWPRMARPKVRRLSGDVQKRLVAEMGSEIARSPECWFVSAR